MKHSFTYYYVQAQKEGGLSEIVYHTHNEKYNEYHHKFLDKKKATALALAEKEITPDVKFRVVKCTETCLFDNWI